MSERAVSPARRAIVAILIASATLAALLAAWPLARPVYAPFTRVLGEMVFDGSRSRDVTFTESEERRRATFDTAFAVTDRAGNHADGQYSTFTKAWLPCSFLCALVVATPLPWRRRLGVLALAVFAAHLVFIARLAVYIASAHADLDAVLSGAERTRSGTVWTLNQIFWRDPSFPFIAMTLLWIVLAVRPSDLRRWIAPREPDSA